MKGRVRYVVFVAKRKERRPRVLENDCSHSCSKSTIRRPKNGERTVSRRFRALRVSTKEESQRCSKNYDDDDDDDDGLCTSPEEEEEEEEKKRKKKIKRRGRRRRRRRTPRRGRNEKRRRRLHGPRQCITRRVRRYVECRRLNWRIS